MENVTMGSQIGGMPLTKKPVTMQYVQPTDEQKEKMQIYRDLFDALYTEVSKLNYSRGRSIAQTKIEEASMWVNKAITLND